VSDNDERWPALPLDAWRDTYATLHLWLQIVGKVQLALTPWVNHGWHVALRVTARGLGTGVLPLHDGAMQMEFDFPGRVLRIVRSDGRSSTLPLEPQTVAAFHQRLMDELKRLGVSVRIHSRPNEVRDPIPFAEDDVHASYDAGYAERFWRVLVSCDRVFNDFRARFLGKCSPVHFFWGSPDLAVTRFSGRTAPLHPGGIPGLPDRVTQEAYSHEVSSAGFWPGGEPIEYPAFYSYAYPEPEGFADWPVTPAAAFYSTDLREFILPYHAVHEARDPDETLLAFLQTTYEAAAARARWDRESLERSPGPP
jgi:hypothetical protein